MGVGCGIPSAECYGKNNLFFKPCFLGLGQMENGLPLKVVLILSSMPVGFIAMVPPTLYDLDIDLANSCWLVTNCLLLIEILLLTSLLIPANLFLDRV